MSQVPRQKTKKLFFGEYPYKVATHIRGGGYLRYYDPTDLIFKCLHTDHFNSWSSNYIDTDELAAFAKLIRPFLKKEIKFRYDSWGVDFYTKDTKLHNKIVDKFSKYITTITEPESEEALQQLQDNSKHIIVDHLPYKKYTHKVVFKQIPTSLRESLVKWIDNYPEESIKISHTTRKYLNNQRGWMNDPFLYISDEKMLMMIGLIASSYISRTDKYILRSSINTSP